MTNNFEEFRIWGFRFVYGGDVWRFGLKASQKKKKKTHLDSFCSGTIVVLLLTLNPKTLVLVVVLLAADQDFLADH
jgi:hypothetical protein